MHFFGNVSSLECRRPIIIYSNLEGVKFENVQENFLEHADKSKGYLEVLTSGLIQAMTFPPSLISPKLHQLCIEHYDVRSKGIVNRDGEVVLAISRETVASMLHFLESTFATFSPTQSLAEYKECPNTFRNTLERKWSITNYGGGYRLPKVITKDHLKPHIHDIVVMLHRVKGSADILVFKEWMYRYIEIILKGEQYMDWAEVIASSLKNQLKHAKESWESFYMASYLTYCMACVCNLSPLPHEIWSKDIMVH